MRGSQTHDIWKNTFHAEGQTNKYSRTNGCWMIFRSKWYLTTPSSLGVKQSCGWLLKNHYGPEMRWRLCWVVRGVQEGLGNSEYLSSTYPVLSQGSKSFTHLIFTTILAGVIYIYEVWSMAVLNCATRFSTCYSVRSRRVGNSSLSLTTVCTRTEWALGT